MIPKLKIKRIIFNWIRNSKEYNLACKMNHDIENWVNKASWDILTPDEKAWIEKYGPEFYMHDIQSVNYRFLINSSIDGCKNIKIEGGIYRVLSEWQCIDGTQYEYLYDSSNFKTNKLKEPRDLFEIKINENTPSVFFKSLDVLEKKYPEYYTRFVKDYKELVVILNILQKKLIKLSTVLFRGDMTLTILKKYYNELYKYSL